MDFVDCVRFRLRPPWLAVRDNVAEDGAEIVGGCLDTGTGGATGLTGVLCAVSSGGTLAVLPQQPMGSGSESETRKNGDSVLCGVGKKEASRP